MKRFSAHDLRQYHAHLWLLCCTLVVLFPFVWIALSAFKTEIDIAMSRVLFTPTLANFDELLASKSSVFSHNFWNSVIVAGATTLLACSAATLAAHSIRRHGWPVWFTSALLLFSMVYFMAPQMTLVGSWYILFRLIGIYDTRFSLVLAHTTILLPMALWLMANFLRDVPVELEEAAAIDGCSPSAIFFKVVLPLVVPGLLATGVLIFIFSWNEFPVSLTLSTKASATVPVAIAKYSTEFETQHGAMSAAAVLSTVPALLIMVVALRYIVRGLTSGALK